MDPFEKSLLNRSFSAPNINDNVKYPMTRKIVVSEFVQYFDHAPLIRQYSCEEIIHNNLENPPRNFLPQQIFNKSFNTANNYVVERNVFEDTKGIEYIPMDIDEEVNELPKKEYNLTDEISDDNLSKTSRKYRKLTINNFKKETNDVKQVNNLNKKKRFYLKHLFGIAVISIATYLYLNKQHLHTNKKIKLHEIRTDLKNELIGQDDAINIILNSIERTELLNATVKILPILGGMGVGKTYLANILKRHFQNAVFEINKRQLYNLIVKDNIFNNLKPMRSNLIIIDNLYPENMKNVISFMENLPNNYKIIVIVIFNTNIVDRNLNNLNDYYNVSYIIDTFTKMNWNCDIVVFNDISLNNVKKWIIKELIKLDVPEYRHVEIIKSLLKQYDLRHGFKGLHSKLILEIGLN